MYLLTLYFQLINLLPSFCSFSVSIPQPTRKSLTHGNKFTTRESFTIRNIYNNLYYQIKKWHLQSIISSKKKQKMFSVSNFKWKCHSWITIDLAVFRLYHLSELIQLVTFSFKKLLWWVIHLKNAMRNKKNTLFRE